MTELPRRQIIGTEVTIASYEQVLDRFDVAISGGERICVCCAPASTLVTARKDDELRSALAAASVVTPDGMGVVYAARLLGEALEGRVYGPDLMLAQCERAAPTGQRVWLYGGFDDEALGQLREQLEVKFPELQIVGGYSPPHRPLTADETSALLERINADRPDVVWIGLGSPKQEKWMAQVRPQLDAAVLCAVGAAFDFHAGRVRQAPVWMQRRGLEWLFRLLREPKRLGPRYLKTNPAFVLAVMGQLFGERFKRTPAPNR
ncbi:MAG: WecB/TagA/CpsF family glycosyltransferase [Thermoleophilaceae bacterium]|nr:WecB/TagA/CpsF family glycosyltransferase [Thermoleophilaceae bacterium]